MTPIKASKIIAADCCMPSLPVIGNCYYCWVLPGTREAYDQMLKQIAAVAGHELGDDEETKLGNAMDILASIGIKQPRS